MGNGLSPRIRVAAPTGATITGTLGGDTVNFVEESTGVYEADVEKLGPWSLSATSSGKTQTQTVSVNDVGLFEGEQMFKPLNDYTWAEISAISQAGTGANLFSLGDIKAVELSGTCGTLSLNTTLYAYIIGFDHNKDIEGSGITFGTWKTANGKDVCLVDANYDTNKGDGTKAFNLNHWGSSSVVNNRNYGGWKGCDARYDILGSTKTAPSGYGSSPTTSRVGYDASTDTATNPVANTLMSCLPSALRAVMKPITKYTDNTGNNSTAAANVTASVDYLPLLSQVEIFNDSTNVNPTEASYQQQYAYYAAGNSKVKYKHSDTGTAAVLWERSPISNSYRSFSYVSTRGRINSGDSGNICGLAPAFLV